MPVLGKMSARLLVTNRRTPSSTHILALPRPAEPGRPARGKTKRKFFRPAELPELQSLVARDSAEFLLPAFEARLRRQSELPAGFVSVGREVAAGALNSLETAARPFGVAAAALPRAIGVGDLREDIDSVPVNPKLPKTMAWASGVPKNLPVEPLPPSVAPAVVAVEVSRRESFLDRLDAAHERLRAAALFPGSAWRRAASFAMLAGVLVVAPVGAVGLTAKTETVRTALVNSGRSGIGAFVAAGQAAAAKDPAAAAREFGRAEISFGEARKNLSGSVGALKLLAGALPGVGKTVRSADNLLTAADALARAGEKISGAVAAGQGDLMSSLEKLGAAAAESRVDVEAATAALDKVDPAALPGDYGDSVKTLAGSVDLIRSGFSGLPEKIRALAEILGRSSRKRYLVVFQNSNELRPTGGFIGSIAEATFDNGRLVETRVPGGGSYDLQGDLKVALLPPEPLRRVTGKWQFHDANWFPDFPTSAKKLAWFYQKGGGPSVDGVIAVNSEIMPALLALTGPIAMPDYGRTITADNVIRETQRIVEFEYDKQENKPKQFVGDLLAGVLQRLQALPQEKLLTAGETLAAALHEKTIQVSFFDENIQTIADESNWTGRLAAGGDRLMVVDTNIGGGKSDAVVKKSTSVEVVLAPDGTVTNTVTLSYSHEGNPSDPFGKETYRDYVRLYVPEGSELLAATGDFKKPPTAEFEAADPTFAEDPLVAATLETDTAGPAGTRIWSETGRKVFGNWLALRPGEKAVVRFVYRSGAGAATKNSAFIAALSGSQVLSYKFRLEKQSGAAREVSVAVRAPESWREVWASDTGAEKPALQRADVFYGAVYEPKF